MCLEYLRRKVQMQVLRGDNTEMDWGLPLTKLVLQSHRGRVLPCSSPLAASGLNQWFLAPTEYFPMEHSFLEEKGCGVMINKRGQSVFFPGVAQRQHCWVLWLRYLCSDPRWSPGVHTRLSSGESLSCQHPTCAGSHQWISNGCFSQCFFGSNLSFLAIE